MKKCIYLRCRWGAKPRTSESKENLFTLPSEVVSCNKSIDARKHFVLSPYLKFAKISMRDRRNQCSFCVYAGYVHSVRSPRIYHGVGILFLHCSSHWGVWRCLRYVDVRRQVSRLSCFYTLLLIAIVRRLELA